MNPSGYRSFLRRAVNEEKRWFLANEKVQGKKPCTFEMSFSQIISLRIGAHTSGLAALPSVLLFAKPFIRAALPYPKKSFFKIFFGNPY